MPEPRVFHRHGPFRWQAKRRSARFDRVWKVRMAELREAEARLAAARAASAAWIAEHGDPLADWRAARAEEAC